MNRSRSLFIVLLGMALAVLPAWSGSRDERRSRDLRLDQEQLRGERSGTIRFQLDRRGTRSLESRRPAVVRDFPLPDRLPVDLELEPFEILTHDARIVAVDQYGERELTRPDFQAYRGRIVGDPDSRVTLTIFEGRIAGSITTWDDHYVVAPASFNLADEDSTQTRVWRQSEDPDQAGKSACGGDTLPPAANSLNAAFDVRDLRDEVATTAIDGNTLLLGHIAIDATYEWYAHLGSLPAAQNYILSLMSQVATIYENEVKVQLQIPYLRIFESAAADPYSDGSLDTGVLLSEMRSDWNANLSGVSRTAAHLFSVRPNGGSGLAYVDVLCNNNQYPGNSIDYGVSSLSASGGSWEPLLVAHELGHNFSSRHTHCYSPPIDYCANEGGCYQGSIVDSPSTIMSYCSTKSATFHARVKDEKIRPAAEAAFPSCIETAGLPGSLPSDGELRMEKPGQCPSQTLADDDGSLNSYFGYNGTAQTTWAKRFTPACYPFKLERVDVQVGHAASVFSGRSVRLLVWADAAGSGDPANATLLHSEDVTLDNISNSVFNQFTLSDAVLIAGGDYYLGFYDLVADGMTNYIVNVDTGSSGDSFHTYNSTDAGNLQAYASGTFMIRGYGGAVGSDALALGWDAPCNEGTTPDQDFAVYTGTIGDYANYSALTCSTDRTLDLLLADLPLDSFVLVVPRTSANEGSYGTDSDGVERAAATLACVAQSVGACE